MSEVRCQGVPCFIDGCPEHWPKESFDFDQTLAHRARVPLGDKLFNQMCQQASDKCGVGEKNGAYKSGFEDCWSIVKPDIIDQLQAERDQLKAQLDEATLFRAKVYLPAIDKLKADLAEANEKFYQSNKERAEFEAQLKACEDRSALFKMGDVYAMKVKYAEENAKLRTALDKMPHPEWCEYWNQCKCGKQALTDTKEA